MYSEKLCDALCTVLDAAARLTRRRLAGYVANLNFWVDEIEHRLRLVDGLVARRREMIAGTKRVYAEDIRRCETEYELDRAAEPDSRDVSTNWEELERTAADHRKRVLMSAAIFLRRCVAHELLDKTKFFELEERLGLGALKR